MRHRLHLMLPLGLAAAFAATTASSATLRFTITNTAPINGFAITPVYSAVHNGSFDAFSRGEAASPGVERLAELGDVGGLPAERLAADPAATAGVVFGPSIPPLLPGQTGSVDINVADPTMQRYFTFLSMVVPSNDTFIGNGNPLAFPLFDALGAFIGPLTINVTGLFVYDAGTEVNDPLGGPAFVQGQDAFGGADENGVVTRGVFGLSSFAGAITAAGYALDGTAIDFLTDPAAFRVARIDITEVPDVAPIPLPAGAGLLLSALAFGGLVARRRRG